MGNEIGLKKLPKRVENDMFERGTRSAERGKKAKKDRRDKLDVPDKCETVSLC